MGSPELLLLLLPSLAHMSREWLSGPSGLALLLGNGPAATDGQGELRPLSPSWGHLSAAHRLTRRSPPGLSCPSACRQTSGPVCGGTPAVAAAAALVCGVPLAQPPKGARAGPEPLVLRRGSAQVFLCSGNAAAAAGLSETVPLTTRSTSKPSPWRCRLSCLPACLCAGLLPACAHAPSAAPQAWDWLQVLACDPPPPPFSWEGEGMNSPPPKKPMKGLREAGQGAPREGRGGGLTLLGAWGHPCPLLRNLACRWLLPKAARTGSPAQRPGSTSHCHQPRQLCSADRGWIAQCQHGREHPLSRPRSWLRAFVRLSCHSAPPPTFAEERGLPGWCPLP